MRYCVRPVCHSHTIIKWRYTKLPIPGINKKLSWCWQTRTTRLKASQGHQTWYILYVRYGFLLVCYNEVWRSLPFQCYICKTHCFWDIWLQKCRDLENRVRCLSWSLEMSPFDGARMTTYWRSIETMSLSHVVSGIFNVEKISRPWNPGQGSIKVIESGTIR